LLDYELAVIFYLQPLLTIRVLDREIAPGIGYGHVRAGLERADIDPIFIATDPATKSS
jgi:hypothetical protein